MKNMYAINNINIFENILEKVLWEKNTFSLFITQTSI